MEACVHTLEEEAKTTGDVALEVGLKDRKTFS